MTPVPLVESFTVLVVDLPTPPPRLIEPSLVVENDMEDGVVIAAIVVIELLELSARLLLGFVGNVRVIPVTPVFRTFIDPEVAAES